MSGVAASGGGGAAAAAAEEQKKSNGGAQDIPATMRAAMITKFGPPESVTFSVDQALPEDVSKHVLVRMHAAAINPVDYKMLAGNLEKVLKIPYVMGLDGAGVVVKVGSGCLPKTQKLLGKSVFVYQVWQEGGMFGEYAWVRQDLAVEKPKNMTFSEAASIPLCGITTYQAFAWAEPKAGHKVLVLGGSGGNGVFALQWLKNVIGAKEIACTCSERNTALCQRMGATKVINYREETWWEVLAGEKYDIIYDTVGGYEDWSNAHKVLGSKGRFVTIAGDIQGKFSVGRMARTVASVVNRKFWSLINGPCYEYFAASPSGMQLNAIREQIELGKIQAVIDSSHDFTADGVAAALARSASHRAQGKVVLVMVPEDDGGNHAGDDEKEAA